MTTKINQQIIIPLEAIGKRLDQALSELLPDYSRSKIAQWIKEGSILANGKPCKAKDKVYGNEAISLNITIESQTDWHAEDLAIDIIYEDDDLLIINKPENMVVHPAAGNYQGTLVNALLHHCPSLENLPRAGLVHRLDKDTTGLLVVAKTLAAHTHLVQQLQQRLVKREYLALAKGVMTGGGSVDEPIGRHPKQRQKMAINPNGKPAITHYRIKEKFNHYTLLTVNLETGRTHQIRVHLASLHHPIVGDQTYNRLTLPKNCNEALKLFLQQFKRQALHAYRLSFTHPTLDKIVNFEAPLPEDFQSLLNLLRRYDVN